MGRLWMVSWVLLAVSSQARADPPRPRIGVVPGIAVNVDAARVDALTQDLADALASELDVDAIGGLEVRRRLSAEGTPADCVTNPTCVAEVAKRLDATQLLFVVMVSTGTAGAIQVDSAWIEPATGRSATRRPLDIAVLADARAKFALSAKLLLPEATARPKPRSLDGAIGTMSTAVPRHVTTPVLVSGGAAIVGLGVGIGFAVKARSKYNDCELLPCDQSRRDSIRSTSIVADLGFAIGVAGAITSGILYATSGKESRLIVAPAMESSGTVSLTASGRF